MNDPDTNEDDDTVYGVWEDVTDKNRYEETWLMELSFGGSVFIMRHEGVYYYHAFKNYSNSGMRPLPEVKNMDEAKEVGLMMWRMA